MTYRLSKSTLATLGVLSIFTLFSMYYIDLHFVSFIQSIPLFVSFLWNDFLPPHVASFPQFVRPVIDTVYLSIVATTISSILAIGCSIMMAYNTTPHPIIRWGMRGIVSFFRNIPFLVWASLLVVLFGVGVIPGLFALLLFGTSFLSRVYAESIEELGDGPNEAMLASGASYVQTIQHGIFPSFLPSYFYWTLFMFEINIRASAILGLVGAGGLGTMIKQTMDLFQYRETAMAVVLLVLLIVTIERWTHAVRERLI